MRLKILLLFCLGLAFNRLHQRFHNPWLRLTFFDVGQGDGALIELPQGRRLLIDGGGGFQDWNLGQKELFLELARKGILTLDQVILTHPDQDHALGLTGLLESVTFKELVHSSALEENAPPLWETLKVSAQARSVPLHAVSRELVGEGAGARVRIFSAPGKFEGTNNHSLLTLIEFAGYRILFTGDIEGEAEEALLPYLTDIDILKVAHHGSKTSSTEHFLDRTQPEIAIISAGPGNHYGHPARPVLHRLGRYARIFRTDFHGFIELTIFPDGILHCRTAQGDCGRFTRRQFPPAVFSVPPGDRAVWPLLRNPNP